MTYDERVARERALSMAIAHYDGRTVTNVDTITNAATRFLAFLNDEVEES